MQGLRPAGGVQRARIPGRGWPPEPFHGLARDDENARTAAPLLQADSAGQILEPRQEHGEGS